MNIVKKNKYVSIIASLLITLNYSIVYGGAVVGMDNFESYSNAEILGDADFPTDPWQSFGATVTDSLTANTAAAQSGSLGASISLEWANGSFGGVFFEFSTPPSFLGTVNIDIRSLVDLPGTTFKAQVIESDGDIFRIQDSFDVTSANTYESFSFDFFNSTLVNDGGSGNNSINLQAIDKVQIVFLNSSGSGIEVFHVDNFVASVPEPQTYAVILGTLTLLTAIGLKKRS